MKPNWKPATPEGVDELERVCREWYKTENPLKSPDVPTWEIMSLVLRIRELEKQLKK